MKAKPKRGRPFLPESERKVWVSMRLTPKAREKLSKLSKKADASEGQIVSHLVEETQAPYGVSQ